MDDIYQSDELQKLHWECNFGKGQRRQGECFAFLAESLGLLLPQNVSYEGNPRYVPVIYAAIPFTDCGHVMLLGGCMRGGS